MIDKVSYALMVNNTRKALSLVQSTREMLSILIQSPERIELKSKISIALLASHTYFQTARSIYASAQQDDSKYENFDKLIGNYELLFTGFLNSYLDDMNYSDMVQFSAQLLNSAFGTIFDPNVELTLPN